MSNTGSIYHHLKASGEHFIQLLSMAQAYCSWRYFLSNFGPVEWSLRQPEKWRVALNLEERSTRDRAKVTTENGTLSYSRPGRMNGMTMRFLPGGPCLAERDSKHFHTPSSSSSGERGLTVMFGTICAPAFFSEFQWSGRFTGRCLSSGMVQPSFLQEKTLCWGLSFPVATPYAKPEVTQFQGEYRSTSVMVGRGR